MKIMDIFVAKNGEVLSNGTPYIRDEYDNCYILTPVPSNYFAGQQVERIARVAPDKLPEGKPPLLSDEGIYDADMSAVTAYIKEHSGKDSWDGSECEMSGRRAIAQTQWDIWNKAIYG